VSNLLHNELDRGEIVVENEIDTGIIPLRKSAYYSRNYCLPMILSSLREVCSAFFAPQYLLLEQSQ